MALRGVVGVAAVTKLTFYRVGFLSLVIPYLACHGWQHDNKVALDPANYLNEELPDDWVDYKDMFNYDMSTKTMKDDAMKEGAETASCPPCICPESGEKASERRDSHNDGERTRAVEGEKDVAAGVASILQDNAESAYNASSGNDTCKAESQLSLVCLSTFRKLFRMIVEASAKALDGQEEEDSVDFRASFKLPVNHLYVLRRVVEMDDKKKEDPNDSGALGCRDLVWALQHFSASIEEVKRHVEGEVIDDNLGGETAGLFPSLEELKGMAQYCAWAVTIVAGAFGLFVMRNVFHASITFGDVSKVVLLLYVVLFVVSIPWNWMSMYQQAQAKQSAVRSQNVPSECASAFAETEATSSSYFQSFTSALKSMNPLVVFSWGSKEDPCQKYHDAFQVNVLGQVPPIKALTVTFNQMALEPMGYIGQAFGSFLDGVFRHLPLHMYPIAAILLVVACMLWKGYHIRLGPLFSIGPAAQTLERLPCSGANCANAAITAPGNPRPSLAQDVANQLIHRLNDENLNLRQELADTRGRILLRLDSDGKSSSSSSSHKPLYTSPFKEPEPLAIETARSSSPSPTRGRTTRSHSAPELKKFHFHPPLPDSSTSSHKMSTPSSSRRATLVPISEEGAEEAAASSPTGPGGITATLLNKVDIAKELRSPIVGQMKGTASPADVPAQAESMSKHSLEVTEGAFSPLQNGSLREVSPAGSNSEEENGFVLINTERPEDDADVSGQKAVDRNDDGQSECATTPLLDVEMSQSEIEMTSSQPLHSDLVGNSVPSVVPENAVVDETVRLSNLSIDE